MKVKDDTDYLSSQVTGSNPSLRTPVSSSSKREMISFQIDEEPVIPMDLISPPNQLPYPPDNITFRKTNKFKSKESLKNEESLFKKMKKKEKTGLETLIKIKKRQLELRQQWLILIRIRAYLD